MAPVYKYFAAQGKDRGWQWDRQGRSLMDCCFWSGSFHSVQRALTRACLERSDANDAEAGTKEQGNRAVSLETEG